MKHPAKAPVRLGLWLPLIAVVFVTLLLSSCLLQRRVNLAPLFRASMTPPDGESVLVTGYCSCGDCCGWRPRYWFFGDPVVAYGPRKGSPKIVGQTASGRMASKGTVAADPKVYPFGTRLEIPGYGSGRVEDVGGAIKGRHIDVWFPSHAEARAWGARWLHLRILPKGRERTSP